MASSISIRGRLCCHRVRLGVVVSSVGMSSIGIRYGVRVTRREQGRAARNVNLREEAMMRGLVVMKQCFVFVFRGSRFHGPR